MAIKAVRRSLNSPSTKQMSPKAWHDLMLRGADGTEDPTTIRDLDPGWRSKMSGDSEAHGCAREVFDSGGRNVPGNCHCHHRRNPYRHPD
jgi:hypothetical protein